LVVIAIIAVLIGLLLPAVQKVRAAAARTQCQNNLHNIVIACHSCHDVNGHFPQGTWTMTGNRRWWSWMALLLPFYEQQALYTAADKWAETNSYSWTNGNPGTETPMKIWQCPSDARQPLVKDYGSFKITFTGLLGVRGTRDTLDDGVLCNTKVTMVGVTDGTSNTLMIGERPPSNDYWFGWWFAGAGYQNMYNGLVQRGTGDVVLGTVDTDFPPSLQNVPFNGGYPCPATAYRFAPGGVTDNCAQLRFWSLHDGGANFAFADGSVRFLRYTIGQDDALMAALATRAGGETNRLPD
jgi:prepilin-type processing-associated H-X9-DG protein